MLERITLCLYKSGNLTKFWLENFDVALEASSSKAKCSTTLNLLNSMINTVDDEDVIITLKLKLIHSLFNVTDIVFQLYLDWLAVD